MKAFTTADFQNHNLNFISDLSCFMDINPNYKARVGGNNIELELVENGQRVFGANIDLYGHKDFVTGGRDFQISKGSMGAFNMECEASVASYMAMAEIIKNFKEVRNVALDYMERYDLMRQANYEE